MKTHTIGTLSFRQQAEDHNTLGSEAILALTALKLIRLLYTIKSKP